MSLILPCPRQNVPMSAAHSLSLTDSQLLQQAQQSDHAAWNRLVELYGPLVLYWCRQAELQAADRADVFQDVFRAIAVHLPRFQHGQEGQTFRGWVRQITRSKIADHYRRRQKQPLGQGGTAAQEWIGSVAAGAIEPEDESTRLLELRKLRQRALELMRGQFSEQVWQAFWRTAVDGCNATEVGLELDMKPDAVRKAKSRVLLRLRDEFGALLE